MAWLIVSRGAARSAGGSLLVAGELLGDAPGRVRVDVLAQDQVTLEREHVDAVPGDLLAARVGGCRRPLRYHEVGSDVGRASVEAKVGPVAEDGHDVLAH